jgi:hypothetical protein
MPADRFIPLPRPCLPRTTSAHRTEIAGVSVRNLVQNSARRLSYDAATIRRRIAELSAFDYTPLRASLLELGHFDLIRRQGVLVDT